MLADLKRVESDTEHHVQDSMPTWSSLFGIYFFQAIQIHRVTLMESENHISGRYTYDIIDARQY